MRLTYKAQDQNGKETGTVWYASTAGDSIFPKSDKEEQVLKKLAAYEDAEEQGRLVILPCKVGDMVYYRRRGYIIGDDVKRIVLDGLDNQVIVDHNHAYMFSDFGSNVWTSREEAEAALKGEREDA